MSDHKFLTPKRRVLVEQISASRRRAIRRRFGLLSGLDSPYFRLPPPPLKVNETIGPPDFVGIGAQRAGTSWWFDLVRRHPNVYHRSVRETNKERQFFTQVGFDGGGDELISEYASWFPRIPGTVTGEWTPDYLFCSWVPPLLRAAAPEARLLVMLRDPVERCISGYGHGLVINGGAMPQFSVLQDAISRGEYASQLRRWFEIFPAEQFLILQYEACRARADQELRRTFEFLGLDPEVLSGVPTERLNQATWTPPELSPPVRRQLTDLYLPEVQQLARLVPGFDFDLWPNFAGKV